ncbi:MAG: sigma 54-interacting transcriptional regulator [Planctomycetota bacterium]
MAYDVLLSDPRGPDVRKTVSEEEFWIGAGSGDWAFGLPVDGIRGPLVEVRHGAEGVEVRAEPGLPVSVRTVAGELGTRFEPLLEGEDLWVGDLRVAIRWTPVEPKLRGFDTAFLKEASSSSELLDWFESFMSLADHMDGVRDVEDLAEVSLRAVLETTGADRVFLQLDCEGEAPREWFRSRRGGTAPFGVSRSTVARVRTQEGVVFVPESSADPVVAGLVSVRREGISSSLAVPLRALGRSVGVLYADCVEPGSSLKTGDFRVAAVLGRMLASAVGNRNLMHSVIGGDSELPEALQTRSPAYRDVVEKARLFAPTDYKILIRGETGSGKDELARALHRISERAKGPFIAVNSAAIPAQLMESQLFGHVKGSFTGATSDREGFFVAADRGTLFLDEIGDMEPDLQSKILRVLETREVTPVGGTKSRQVDVRILAATHQNLEQMVEEKTFREDLYYRLKELEIRIPPLRQRPEDILSLAEGFLEEAASELPFGGRPRLHAEAARFLMEHPWRGNVRELRHAIRTALLRAGGEELLEEHFELLPSEEKEDDHMADAANWRERLELTERKALQETLDQAGGNLTKAAKLFGLPRTTYREKLLKHGLLD